MEEKHIGIFRFACITFFLVSALTAEAATIAKPLSSTANAIPQFETIQKLAHNGKRKEAIQLAQQRLQSDPNDWDTRVVLGYAYLWEDQNALAKKQFTLVLKNKPHYTDAKEGLIRAEKNLRSPSKAAGNTNVTTFENIQKLAHNGQSEQAEKLALTRLQYHPTDWDTRVTLGYIYLWNDQYDLAREQFEEILKHKPKYADARIGLIKVAAKTGHAQEAFTLIDEGTTIDPTNDRYIYERIRLYIAENTYQSDEKAIQLTQALLKANPNDQDAQDLMNYLETLAPYYVWKNQIAFYQEEDHVSDLNQVWSFSNLYYTRQTPIGSVQAEVDYANKFDTSAGQYQINAYPHILPNVYVYLNYGYSPNNTLFPEQRFGVEPFINLPHGFEASLGERYLQFDSITRIYTGSIAKYVGNYWFMFRPYYTPETKGASTSYYLTARKYYENSLHYISISAGGGGGPDQTTVDQTNSSATSNEKIYIEGSNPITKQVYFYWTGGYINENFPHDHNRQTLFAGVQLVYMFGKIG